MLKKREITIALCTLLVISLFFLTQTISGHSSNVAFCNIQGKVFNTNNNPLNRSQITINCTLIRDNAINTTYSTKNGNNFPTSSNHSYRCAMACSNITVDTVEINFYNTTHETYNLSSFITATKQFNFTLLTVTAPTIYNITGNTSATTGDTLTVAINATDNINVTAANIALNNGTILQMLETQDERFAINISPPNNSVAALSYIITAYDRYLLTATSANYTITVTDNDAPTVHAGQTITINQNQRAQFNSSNSSDNIAITSYLWNFNVSNATVSTAANPSYNYTISGTYNVSLTITDAANNNATAYVTVIVNDDIKPTILSTIPTNGSTAIARTANIIINFSEAIQAQTLNNSISITDQNSNQIAVDIYYNASTNSSTIVPVLLLKENTTYIVNITKNIQDTAANNMTTAYILSFTTKLQDTDNDGIADINDSDKDNDGITNALDKLNGNASTIYSNIGALTVAINGSTNLSQAFNSTADVRIYNKSKEILEFQFDFAAASIDLTNITIYETNNATVGEIIINGLNLAKINTKKILFLTNKSDYSGVCIKDAEITAISQISTECNGSNEVKVECNSQEQSGYSCSYNTTLSKYKITGLSNSGIRQISYTQPITGVSGSGGGGGGGGGAILKIQPGQKNTSKPGECTTNLDCNELQYCTNNICTAVPCSKGYISNHFCIPLECTENSDCQEKTSKICYANKCRECITNTDCTKDYYCQQYSCKKNDASIEQPREEIIKELTIAFADNKQLFYTGGIITIEVHDNQNNAVAKATITAIYHSKNKQQTTTNINGNAQLEVKEEGTITITAEKQGYKASTIEITATQQSFFAKLFQNIDAAKITVTVLLAIIIAASMLLMYYMVKPIQRR